MIKTKVSTSQFPFSLNESQKIWAIGGGKGGVGKSLVTANLSISLAMIGYRVVAIDFDLGGANLHTCLGMPMPEKTLSDYINKRVGCLEDLLTPTSINNLKIISGAQDDMHIANIKALQKNKLIANLQNIDTDFLLLDLGAGTSFNALDFFIAADQGILTTLPEPTAIENTYRFIKSVYCRKIKQMKDTHQLGSFIEETMNSKISEGHTPIQFINHLISVDPEMGRKVQMELESLIPKLVINQVRTQTDVDIGFSMKVICRKYFGIELDYIGYLNYDASVWQSVKKRRPLLTEYPSSILVKNFDRIVHQLLELS